MTEIISYTVTVCTPVRSVDNVSRFFRGYVNTVVYRAIIVDLVSSESKYRLCGDPVVLQRTVAREQRMLKKGPFLVVVGNEKFANDFRGKKYYF